MIDVVLQERNEKIIPMMDNTSETAHKAIQVPRASCCSMGEFDIAVKMNLKQRDKNLNLRSKIIELKRKTN